jgi:hypothetical protein
VAGEIGAEQIGVGGDLATGGLPAAGSVAAPVGGGGKGAEGKERWRG